MFGGSTLTLKGKQLNTNLLRLSGKISQPVIPPDISIMQVNIMNNIVLPLVKSQWNTVQQNLFLVDLLKPRIDMYYSIYKFPELLLYKEVLSICNIVLNEPIQLVDLEKRHYGSTMNNLTNIVFKTAMIKIKPEYSLYNMILGTPKFAEGKMYIPEILEEIRILLIMPNASYEIIRNNIIKKFVN